MRVVLVLDVAQTAEAGRGCAKARHTSHTLMSARAYDVGCSRKRCVASVESLCSFCNLFPQPVRVHKRWKCATHAALPRQKSTEHNESYLSCILAPLPRRCGEPTRPPAAPAAEFELAQLYVALDTRRRHEQSHTKYSSCDCHCRGRTSADALANSI